MTVLARSITTSYLARAVTILASLAVFSLMAHRLGLALFGAWVLVSSVATWLTAADFGMGAAIVTHLARARARRDEGLQRAIVVTGVAFFAAAGIATALILVVVLGLTWDRLNIPEEIRGIVVEMLVLVIVVSVLLAFPLRAFATALMGLQRYDLHNGIVAVGALARVALVGVSVLVGAEVLVVVAAYLSADLLIGGLAWLATRRLLPAAGPARSSIDLRLLRKFAPLSAQVFTMSLATIVILYLDNFVIGLFLPVAAVGIYAAAFRIYRVGRELAATMIGPFVPRGAQLDSAGDIDRLRVLFLRGTRYLLLGVMTLAIAGIMLGEGVLVLWLGPEFRPAGPVLQLLLVSLVVNANHLVATSVLTGMGRISEYVVLHVLWAVANLVLSVILVQHLGLIGVALGTAIPILVLEPLYVLVALRRFRVSAAEFLRECVVRPAAAVLPGALLLASWPVLVGHATESWLVELLIPGVLYLATVVPSAWLLTMDAGERTRVRDRLAKGAR